MSSTLLSIAYLPNIEWLAHFIQGKEIWIEAHETFQKQTYRSRALISGPQGIQVLNVPVQKQFKGIRECTVSYAENWTKDHLKAIESAYAKSPFYEVLMPDLANILNAKPQTLWELNTRILELVLYWLDHPSTWKATKAYQTDFVGTDLRQLSPKGTQTFTNTEYHQVFFSKNGFQNNLSALDLLFNLGRSSWDYLNEQQLK
jgi:hypothetical protein